VEWDASGWHFCTDVLYCGPLTAQCNYLFSTVT